MRTLIAGAMAFLLVTPKAEAQAASDRRSELDAIRALPVDTVMAGVMAHYSPGYRYRAEALGPLIAESLRFFADSLGVNLDFRVAVLDRQAWGRASESPYGLPHVSSRNGVSLAVLPADGCGAVFDAYRGMEGQLAPAVRDRVALSGLAWDDLAHRMVDLIGLHEVGHAVSRAFGVDPPTKWLHEVVASYLAHLFLSARRPDQAAVWELMTHAAVVTLQPRHRTLHDFERLYTAVGVADYIWFQSAFARRATRLAEQEGLTFMAELRSDLAATRYDTLSTEAVLARLEGFAPGFREWAARFPPPPPSRLRP